MTLIPYNLRAACDRTSENRRILSRSSRLSDWLGDTLQTANWACGFGYRPFWTHSVIPEYYPGHVVQQMDLREVSFNYRFLNKF